MADAGSRRSAARKTASRPRSSSHERTEIVLADLHRGTVDSDSVRFLQKRLKLKQTGTYDRTTQGAVRAWQNDNGFVGGRGLRLDERQATQLLGDKIKFVDPA